VLVDWVPALVPMKVVALAWMEAAALDLALASMEAQDLELALVWMEVVALDLAQGLEELHVAADPKSVH